MNCDEGRTSSSSGSTASGSVVLKEAVGLCQAKRSSWLLNRTLWMAAWGTELKFRLCIKAWMYAFTDVYGLCQYLFCLSTSFVCNDGTKTRFLHLAIFNLPVLLEVSGRTSYDSKTYLKQCDATCPLMLLTAKCGSRSTRSASVKPLISKARGRWSTTAWDETPLPRPRIPRPRLLRAPRPLPWAPLPRPGVRSPLLAAWMKTPHLSL